MNEQPFRPGDRIVHRHNPGLGPGRVARVEGRTLVVEFPQAGETLRLSAGSEALAPLSLRPGQRVRVGDGPATARITACLPGGACLLDDGRRMAAADLWPLEETGGPLERLAGGDIDLVEEFANRLDALHLLRLREAEGLGSFLGGRIRLFPHQLYVAEQATRADPVRWLLADEVGLGKTVEACLILNRLVHTGRAGRILVVAPETLTVQWLGELWRKHHQVFALLDEARLADVTRDFGAGFNPFDVHRRAIVGLQTLVDHPRLTEQAVAAGIDLVIVDEAHHLRRPPGHPGNAAWRAVAPLAEQGRHLLLLTATPLDEDAHGFLRLLQMLRPEAFPAELDAAARLSSGEPMPACTSATRRVDIGGLPPRVHAPAEADPGGDGWRLLDGLVEEMRGLPGGGPLARRTKADRIRRALAAPAALAAVVPRDDKALHARLAAAAAANPRVAWLAAAARRWREAGDKTLIFVAHRESLEALKAVLEPAARLRVGIFHEDLSPGQRDIEVAQFRLADGPSLLISTECGGEGRNFEFCRRLVLFDLPWNPVTVEQRIGRLDRIGRREDVEVVTFRPPAGLGAAIARLHEALGLFQEPLGGLDRELAAVEAEVESAALDGGPVPADRFATLVEEVRQARRRVRDAAHQALHQSPYRPEMAEFILRRVPHHLDELNEEVVLAACRRLGLEVEPQRREGTWLVELSPAARVDSLPGVAPGARFLGTFRRELAVEDESLDFLAAGHPLVEGVLAELEDSPRGRTALLEVESSEAGFALLALYRDGAGFTAHAVDGGGRPRPDLAARLTRPPLRTRRVSPEEWTGQPGWEERIRALAAPLAGHGRPEAVAAVRLVRRRG